MTTLRPYFAWALLAYVAAELFFIFLSWVLIDEGTTLLQRSYRTDTTTLTTIGLPLLAVLICTQVRPALDMGSLIAKVALVEYLIILLFGGMTFLLGMMHVVDFVDDIQSQIAVLSHMVFALFGFGLTMLAGLAVWQLRAPAQA